MCVCHCQLWFLARLKQFLHSVVFSENKALVSVPGIGYPDLAEKSCKYLLCYEWLWAIEGKEKQNRFCLSLIFLSPSEIWKIPPENSILTWPHKPMSYVFKLAARSREKWLFCYKSGVLYGDKTSLNAGGEKACYQKYVPGGRDWHFKQENQNSRSKWVWGSN